MSKVLLIGYNPPPLEGGAKIEAAHYRTWQFLDPLLSDGCEVCFCANTDKPATAVPAGWAALQHHPLPLKKHGWIRRLQRIHDDFAPDCVVAVNFDCSLAATKLRTQRPIWMDVYGDYLTIVQVARFRAGSDRGVPTSIGFMHRVLRNGDVYSVCGGPQAHMMVGELAMAGRLNSRSFGYEFTRTLPAGCPPNVPPPQQTRLKRTLLADQGVSDHDFVALWCGGYNQWTDVDTLFEGVESAMARDALVHFVSVGANSYEAPDNVYRRLLDKIQTSRFPSRWHMFGWRPWTEIACFYAESNVGINIDAPHYETIFGTRTRLVEMLAAGLPVVTSRGSELSRWIADNEVGFVFESGDSAALTDSLLRFAQDETLHRSASRRAAEAAQGELSFANTMRSLRDWVRDPRRAPDRDAMTVRRRAEQATYQARSLLRQAAWSLMGRSGG